MVPWKSICIKSIRYFTLKSYEFALIVVMSIIRWDFYFVLFYCTLILIEGCIRITHYRVRYVSIRMFFFVVLLIILISKSYSRSHFVVSRSELACYINLHCTWLETDLSRDQKYTELKILRSRFLMENLINVSTSSLNHLCETTRLY